ncbi:MAG: alpha/beta hydrolase [Dongiaceae bacterium]
MNTGSFLGLGPHGFHRIAYAEWGGDAAARTLLCAHGLTRNGRDFDRLAAAFDGDRRVVCPDLPGRGRSDWLPQAADYTYAQYLADMTALIARMGVAELDWLGTSMGGLIGLMLAAQPDTPIRRLVLNDIGPFVPKAALERIAGYVGRDPRFASLDELEAYLREVHAPFGPLDDSDWRHMALQGYRRREDGGFGLAYDPAIGAAFRTDEPLADVDLWAAWGAVRCPVLVLRGGDSDLLLPDTAERLSRDGATVVEFPGVGHAPALMAADQIAVVREWLAAG